MAKHVLTALRGRTFFIQLNRPDVRNCINRETASSLTKAFIEFEECSDATVGVIHGSGGNFCAGRDLSESSEASIEENDHLNSCQSSCPSTRLEYSWFTQSLLAEMPVPCKPLIAAIDGYAVAEGLELALLADLRIVEDTSILGVFGRRFGVPLTNAGSGRLTAVVGLTRALDLILTGRPINGTEAGTIGLATTVCSTGTVLGRATNLAESLVKFPQGALKADKASVYQSIRSMTDQITIEQNNVQVYNSVIVREAEQAAVKFKQSGIGKHGKFSLVSDKSLKDEKNIVKSRLIKE